MGKRKSNARDEDASDASESSEEVEEPKPKKVKKEKAKAKVKEAKPAANKVEATSSDVTLGTNGDGEQFVDLGKMRRATVRPFKGSLLIDLREFYTPKDDPSPKPGKKGISLSVDQWNALKAASGTIDQLIATTPAK